MLEPGVAGGGDPGIPLPDQLDAVGQSLERASRLLVRRAVVDHDHLRRPALLAEGAIDRLEQEVAVVEARDHHRDVVVAGHGSGPQGSGH